MRKTREFDVSEEWKWQQLGSAVNAALLSARAAALQTRAMSANAQEPDNGLFVPRRTDVPVWLQDRLDPLSEAQTAATHVPAGSIRKSQGAAASASTQRSHAH